MLTYKGHAATTKHKHLMLLNCPHQEHCMMLAVQASKWDNSEKIAKLKISSTHCMPF